MSVLRALVIGAGPAAVALHLPVLARLRDRGRLALCELCDLDTVRAGDAARAFGFLASGGDATAAIERADIDVVYVFGSAQMHHEYGLAALGRAKHLFVEKPIAPDYVRACELARAAQVAGRVAAGGHNRRFHAALLAARAQAGRAGWAVGEAVFHKPEFGRAAPFGARSWLSANGIHALDALLYVMGGPPDELYAAAGAQRGSAPATFTALLRWHDGRHASFLCNNEAGGRCESYRFHAAGETFTLGEHDSHLDTAGGRQPHARLSVGDGIEQEHDAFLDAVVGQAPAAHALAALAPSLFVAELIERGHAGAVCLPPLQPPSPSVVRRRAGAASVLVSGPAGLLPALARHLPGYRLVALEELERCTGPRPDIAAAVLGRSATPWTEALLDRLPRLGVVGVMGLSVARFRPELLLARNVALVNAGGAYADSVAEFVLALALLGRRRAFVSHEVMRRGGWGTSLAQVTRAARLRRAATGLRPAARALHLERWLLRQWQATRPARLGEQRPDPGPGLLAGSSVGLVGWGGSARRSAQLLLQLGARVAVWSEHAGDAELQAAGVVRADLGRVLAADTVSLHRGLTAATHHGLGVAELDRLQPGCTLINVARGGLVEPQALLRRLRRGDVLACLDSFEEEPLPAGHALRRLPNVFLTSHIAGGSHDMHQAAADEVAGKVREFLEGGAPATLHGARLGTMS